jgi:hypothetical protein
LYTYVTVCPSGSVIVVVDSTPSGSDLEYYELTLIFSPFRFEDEEYQIPKAA